MKQKQIDNLIGKRIKYKRFPQFDYLIVLFITNSKVYFKSNTGKRLEVDTKIFNILDISIVETLDALVKIPAKIKKEVESLCRNISLPWDCYMFNHNGDEITTGEFAVYKICVKKNSFYEYLYRNGEISKII